VAAPARTERRRADAERSIEAILDAAVLVLAERPDAGLGEVARSAGVTRQTVYAHFSSRAELLTAVRDRALAQSLEAMDAARLDEGDPAEALDRLVGASWRTLARHARLLEAIQAGADVEEMHALHAPIRGRIERLVRRGQRVGSFAPGLAKGWASSAVVALFHAAAAEVAAGRLSAASADRQLRLSARRLLGAAERGEA
jgi:AcrR family transcriptional regulator